jgi:hypothetical protein
MVLDEEDSAGRSSGAPMLVQNWAEELRDLLDAP